MQTAQQFQTTSSQVFVSGAPSNPFTLPVIKNPLNAIAGMSLDYSNVTKKTFLTMTDDTLCRQDAIEKSVSTLSWLLKAELLSEEKAIQILTNISDKNKELDLSELNQAVRSSLNNYFAKSNQPIISAMMGMDMLDKNDVATTDIFNTTLVACDSGESSHKIQFMTNDTIIPIYVDTKKLSPAAAELTEQFIDTLSYICQFSTADSSLGMVQSEFSEYFDEYSADELEELYDAVFVGPEHFIEEAITLMGRADAKSFLECILQWYGLEDENIDSCLESNHEDIGNSIEEIINCKRCDFRSLPKWLKPVYKSDISYQAKLLRSLTFQVKHILRNHPKDEGVINIDKALTVFKAFYKPTMESFNTERDDVASFCSEILVSKYRYNVGESMAIIQSVERFKLETSEVCSVLLDIENPSETVVLNNLQVAIWILVFLEAATEGNSNV